MRQNASSADIDEAAFNELMDMAESGSLGVAASQEQMDAFSKPMRKHIGGAIKIPDFQRVFFI